ncbi:hypothetical protein GCM10009739_26690 [Microbacterium ulmi]
MTRYGTKYRSRTAKAADPRRPAPDAAGYGCLLLGARSYLTVMDQTTPVLLTSREVADLLRVPLRTVEDWRVTRSGPPWLKLGRHVRYDRDELLAWVKERRHG